MLQQMISTVSHASLRRVAMRLAANISGANLGSLLRRTSVQERGLAIEHRIDHCRNNYTCWGEAFALHSQLNFIRRQTRRLATGRPTYMQVGSDYACEAVATSGYDIAQCSTTSGQITATECAVSCAANYIGTATATC